MDGNKCDFCLSEFYSKQGVAENAVARVIYPLRPVVFGHFMVITKRHVALLTDLTNEELSGIRELISKIYDAFMANGKANGFNILNNNGRAGNQHVPHTHIHLFMRPEGEVSPFDVLGKKVEKEKLSEHEWVKRLELIRSWLR